MDDHISWLESRRSIRRYLPLAVPAELIERLLTAAAWAPSAHNRQPWRFAVITSQNRIHELAQAMGRKLRADLTADGLAQHLIDADVQRSHQRITGAPLIILLCLSMSDMDHYPDDSRMHNEWVMAVQSTAMAGQNLLLAAHALGLGACWMCAPLFSQQVVTDSLSLPQDWQPQALVTIGWAAESRQEPRQKSRTPPRVPSRHPLHSRVIYFT